MKSLLLFSDDGLSTNVWLQMALQYLESGRTVLAITDTDNVHGAIGIGDDLKTYFNGGLEGHPCFQTAVAGREDGAALLQQLKALADDTVVMFNMSAFEFFHFEPKWREVLAFCADSPHEMVITSYYSPSSWARDLDTLRALGSEVKALTAVDWDYISGGRIVNPWNIEPMRQLFPGLAAQIAVPANHHDPFVPKKVTWQIINRTGTFELRTLYNQYTTDMRDFPEMWDVQFEHVLAVSPPEQPVSGQKKSILRRLSLAFFGIFDILS
jgi:hypothetical protein